MAAVLTNNAVSRLASSLTAGATTLSVTTGEGGKFPSPSAGQWFPLTIVKSSGVLEVARCTARSGDVFTVVRAQESTSAQSFTAGDRVELRATAAVFTEQTANTKAAQDAADAAQSDADQAQTEVDALEGLAVKKDASTATGAALIPGGTTAQRPVSPTEGMLRQNTETKETERYQDGKWLPLNILDKALNEAPPVTIASASTVDIGAAAANTLTISGTVTILALGTIAAGAVRRVLFSGALLLTHNPTSLILPGGASITTAAGDNAVFVSLGGGNWRCLRYSRYTDKSQCTAWVNFNGTGTVSIRDSFNVSSITDNGQGDYTINFTKPMLNANYTWAGAGKFTPQAVCVVSFSYGVGVLPSLSGIQVTATDLAGNKTDPLYLNAQFFGGQ